MSEPPLDDNPEMASMESEDNRLAILMRRVACGDGAALAELYDLTSSQVYGLVLRVVGSPDQALQITQGVYVDIAGQASQYDDSTGSALAWIIAKAHRRAVALVRAISPHTASAKRITAVVRQRRWDALTDATQPGFDVKQVRHGLESLTEVQHAAVGLVYFAGYTYTDVARLLDLPLTTVEAAIREGLSTLRTCCTLLTPNSPSNPAGDQSAPAAGIEADR